MPIQKLKQRKNRRRVICYSSSDSEEHVGNGSDLGEHNDASPGNLPVSTITSQSPVPMLPDQQELNSPLDLPTPQSLDDVNDPTVEVDPVVEIDPELLQALGDPSDDVPVYGPDIHSTLAQRWLPILKKGVLAEAKEKTMKTYLVPENCKLLRTPTLNPEISAAVSDTIRSRDKKMQMKQDQLGIGITAISRAMTLLLTNEDKAQAVKCLSDGCRILTDLHFIETQVRTKLITPGLDKSILTVLLGESRNETLFGNTLSEKIKASKAIEKQGLQNKKTQNLKVPTPAASSSNVRPRNQGNWSAPHPTGVITDEPHRQRYHARRLRWRTSAPQLGSDAGFSIA